MPKYFIKISLWSLIYTTVSLAQSIVLKGNIVDELNTPLEYVNVIVYSSDSTMVNGTTTDRTGNFEVKISPNKAVYLKLSYIGYDKKIIEVNSYKNNTFEAGTIRMDPSQFVLNDITVTAERPFIERKIDRLVVNVNKSVVNTGGNALDILDKSPGVLIDMNGAITLNGRSGASLMINSKQQRLSVVYWFSQNWNFRRYLML